ncbi:MAG: WYL domain-containing protein [Saprospiraceae bacterium]|nr:WYL domain-containing protein [Saprospiraceae bacterium]
MYIEGKLANLYNFQELGLRALRRPALDKIDNLNLAMKERKSVVLKNYRSNSGTLKDRLVEPFHLDVELDTLQAFDIEIRETRHYKLARIERVEVTDQKWQGGGYIAEKTDVFRIVKNEQVMVHLKLKAQAHNYLTEQYPKSISEIHPSSEPQTWDFESKVNKDFLGLSNFILANTEHVEIVYPLALKEHIKEKIKAFLSKLE